MTKWVPDVEDASPPLYLAIARALALDVASGRLESGDRLPPQRELADALGVALGTVTRAYAEAERRGLVKGRGRRGTLVTGAGLDASGLSVLRDADGLVDLLANHPGLGLAPDLGAALAAVASQPNVGELLAYPPTQGLARHREAMAAWLRGQKVPARADGLVMTAGAQHGMTAALAAVARAGDELACEALTYPGIKASAAALGVRLLPVACDEHGLLPDAFEHACRRRSLRALYTIPSLHNPTSATLPLERRRAIARSAERRDVAIIEDEIHRALLSSPPPGFAALAPERTLHVASPSKVVVGGLRVGAVLAPPAWREAVGQFVQASLIGCPGLNAEVFALWIRDGTAQRTAVARRGEARARQQLATRLLRASGARLRSRPESGLAWLELPEAWPAERFAREARERGVAVAPADLFAVDSRQLPNAVRLALSGPADRHQLTQGLEVLARMLAGAPSPPGTATL